MSFTICTKTISRQLALDLEKHNAHLCKMTNRKYNDHYICIRETINFRKIVQDAVNKCASTTEKLAMYIQAYHSSANLKFPVGAARCKIRLLIQTIPFGFLMYSAARSRKQSDEMLEMAIEVAESIFKNE